MSKLILNTDCNMDECNEKAYCRSRQVAEEIERRHEHLLRLIDDLTTPTSGGSAEFSLSRSGESSYNNAQGKRIIITPDKFDVFRRAIGHLVADLMVGKKRMD